MFGDVLVPIDGSNNGKRALRIAKHLSLRLGGRVHVVAFHGQVSARTFTARIDELVKDELGEVSHTVDIREQSSSVVSDILLETKVQPSSLLCVPTHGHGRSAALVGSVATALVTGSNQPVLLAGPRCSGNRFDSTRPVVVARDPDADSAAITRVARSWGTLLAAPLVPFSVPAESAASSSDVAEKIVAAADEADASIIAMATSGPSGIDRLRRGSVAASVVSEASCPVLVLHVAEDGQRD